jgi:hypothetical protein
MAIVIGATTTVSFPYGDCVVSVNWGYNPNIQRLYCLGSWDVYDTINRPTQTMNVSIYAPGSAISVLPTGDCANASPRITASVSPTVCGETVDGVSGDWYLTSYSYSKDDPVGPGQESWSMTLWVAGGDTPAPTYVIRGIAEGQASNVNGVINSGVVFTGTTEQASTGSVSAGGVGRAYNTTIGQVISVGGGTNTPGETGSASVSIPYTPLWL